MAVNDGSTPLFEDLSEREGTTEKDAGQPAGPIRGTGTALIRVVDQSPSLHRMHEGRIVKSAGRMLVGSPAPIPTLEDVLNDTPMFSSRAQRQWSVSGGAAVALACAVAIGSAVALTGVMNRNAGYRTAGEGDGVRMRGPAHAAPVAQSMTMSEVGAGGGRQDDPQTVQSTQAPPVRVAAAQENGFAVNDITGAPGEPLPLRVSIPQTGPQEYSFLMFRGLPANVTISSGFRLKDSWAVSLRDLDALKLRTSPDFEGQFKLEVLLIKGREKPAESRVLTVTIQQPGASGAAVAARAAGSQVLTAASPANTLQPAGSQTTAAAQRTPSISPAEEAPLFERAVKALDSYDISSARLLFEHLANLGSAKAALALGQTYDPAFFRTVAVRGMRPDAAMAKQWYRRAADLGNTEAASRLSTLNAR
jgi:hypothetical protein